MIILTKSGKLLIKSKKENYIDILNLEEMKKYLINFLKKKYDLQKSRAFPVGTIRIRKDGRKYKKVSKDKWSLFYEGQSRGQQQAVRNVMKKIEKAENIQELAKIIKENRKRFIDEKGNIDKVVNDFLVTSRETAFKKGIKGIEKDKKEKFDISKIYDKNMKSENVEGFYKVNYKQYDPSILKAKIDDNGNVNLNYANVDFKKERPSKNIKAFKVDVKSGIIDGKPYNLNLEEAKTVKGQTYNLNLKNKGFFWDQYDKEWKNKKYFNQEEIQKEKKEKLEKEGIELTELEGSAKQIAWANDIRTSKFKEIDEIFDKIEEKRLDEDVEIENLETDEEEDKEINNKQSFIKEMKNIAKEMKNNLAKLKRATFWIEERNTKLNELAFLAKGVNIDSNIPPNKLVYEKRIKNEFAKKYKKVNVFAKLKGQEEYTEINLYLDDNKIEKMFN